MRLAILLLVLGSLASARQHPCLEPLLPGSLGSTTVVTSIALEGDAALVAGFGSAGAYFLEPGPTGWSVSGYLPGSSFLIELPSVALEGDWGFLGNSEDLSLNGRVQGARRGVAGWAPAQQLVPSDAGIEDGFGRALAVDGSRLIVTAPHSFQLTAGDFNSKLYEFELVGGAWLETQIFQASQWSSLFGQSCALDGDLLAVGDPNHSAAASGGGSVVVFERIAGFWTETARLYPSDPTAHDRFGWSVAMDDGRLFVGTCTATGRAYLFEQQSQGWTEVRRFEPSSSATFAKPAASIDLSGDWLAQCVGWGSFEPELYLYRREGSSWLPAAQCAPRMGGTSLVAAAIAPDGTVLVSDDSGALGALEVAGLGVSFCASTTNSTGLPATLSISECASVQSPSLALVAAPVPLQPGLFLYGGSGPPVPLGGGSLCLAGPMTRSPILFAHGGRLRWSPNLGSSPHAQLTAGSTWSFQAWYRDPQAGLRRSNLSSGLWLTLQP